MMIIWRNAVLLALVPAFAACAVHGAGRTATKIAAAHSSPPAPHEAAENTTPGAAIVKEKTTVHETLLFDIYRRGGRYYVTAGVRGPGVDGIEVPDVIPVEPAVESIAAALRILEPLARDALVEAQRGEREYVDEKLWERMGAKNERQFVRSTSSCDVYRFSDQIKVWYMVPDAKGYIFTSHGEEPDARFPPDASYEDIARAVLDIFAKNPPPPGDKPAAPKRPRKTAATD